jgi:hypothetical protein
VPVVWQPQVQDEPGPLTQVHAFFWIDLRASS